MKKLLALLLVLSSSAFAFEIHPDMQAAINENENEVRLTGVLSEAEPIIVDGQKQFTGFKPTSQMYVATDYIEIDVPDDWVMKEIDYSTLSYSPVRRQRDNSCWAQGGASCFTLAINAMLGFNTPDLAWVFSAQDYIDCSGKGTAARGGYLSLEHSKKGIATEKDYPYLGGDHRCKTGVARHFPVERAPMVRGKGGKFPTEREINYALWTIGPFEVCGSAGAMKSGGWVENPGRGNTNHCYAHAGMRWGPNFGKVAAWFHGMLNSWGTGWGSSPPGYGWYRLAKEVGGSLTGQSIVTEIMGIITGQPVFPPSGPTEFAMTGSADLKVTVNPGKLTADKTKEALLGVGYKEKK